MYLNKDKTMAGKRKEQDKGFFHFSSIVLLHLYSTELPFRSHDELGHQEVDKGDITGYRSGLSGLAQRQ